MSRSPGVCSVQKSVPCSALLMCHTGDVHAAEAIVPVIGPGVRLIDNTDVAVWMICEMHFN